MTRGAPTKFVVLASPRTGSAWLVDLLHSHPQLVAYPELFLPGGGPAPYAARDLPYFDDYLATRPPWSRSVPSAHMLPYLASIYRRRPGVRAAGFKLMYTQPRRGLLPYLSARRVKAVHLIRANTLETLISYRHAKAAGEFHPRRDEAVPDVTVTVEVSNLRQRLEDLEFAVSRARSTIERYRLPRLEIAYEELVGRRQETLDRVLRFLDVDESEPLESAFVKAVDGRHVDRVENAQAVRRALAGTRFEWMVGDEVHIDVC